MVNKSAIEDFWMLPVDQLFLALKTDENGLQNRLVRTRISAQRKFYKKQSRFQRELKIFFRQFTNPLIFILLVVLFFSVILKERSDTFIVLFIILLSGVLGFIQEVSAGRASEKLLGMIEINYRVLRRAGISSVSGSEVVPGDVILLNAGNIIPADCRIIESNELHVDESALTGENFPVEKKAGSLARNTALAKRFNCLWEGTHIINGTTRALVVNTAENTVFGSMKRSVDKPSSTAFQAGITKFGYFLLKTTVLLSVFIFVSNIYFGKPFFTSLLFSLALAVGMAPELLPAIITFSMAVGSGRMSKKKVIVKQLSSIFNLGEVNMLCTDKTGTVTEGEVRVNRIVDIDGVSNEAARNYTFLNSFFQQGFSNSIDQAIISLGMPIEDYRKLDEIPYDFIRKRLSVLVEKGGANLLITKGAVVNILAVCTYFSDGNDVERPIAMEQRKSIMSKLKQYSQNGFRVLGVAYKKSPNKRAVRSDESDMVFLGFVLLEDSLKGSAISSIDRLRRLNISVKIITGDNRYAALHTAKKLNIKAPKLLTGSALNRLSPEAMLVKVADTDVFAEIEPHQKERIVSSLQKSGFHVAFLGDGINDAAALHAADVGISTNNAVDIAKEASDFVLLEKDLNVVADGIYEGRVSFVNSMKYIYATTGSTFGNMLTVAAASLALPFLPMLPKQILATNLISDFPYLAISSDRIDEEEIVKPLKWDMKMITRFMLVFGLHSSIFDLVTFYTLFYYFKLRNTDFQTGWFLESIATELIIVMIVRSRKKISKSSPSRLLLIAICGAFLFTIWLPISPLKGYLQLTVAHSEQIIALTIIVGFYALTAELLKLFYFRYLLPRAR